MTSQLPSERYNRDGGFGCTVQATVTLTPYRVLIGAVVERKLEVNPIVSPTAGLAVGDSMWNTLSGELLNRVKKELECNRICYKYMDLF